MSDVAVKICGLTGPQDVVAAADACARYVGFVFFPKSPRNVSVRQAKALAAEVPLGVAKVALTVNADDALLDEIKQNDDIILMIDEVHTLIGAGAAEGAIDAANILKPALAWH